MKILLTNDDGYNAVGLTKLAAYLLDTAEIAVVAPEEECSGMGHAISIFKWIKTRTVEIIPGLQGLAVSGTPADCVKLGISALLPWQPDYVVCGINPGLNTGNTLFYSGTVGAAAEAAMLGVPAVAFSVDASEHKYESPFKVARRIVKELGSKLHIEPGTFLNINIPSMPFEEIKGYKVTRHGSLNFSNRFQKKEEKDCVTYKLQIHYSEDSGEFIDITAVRQGFVSITVLACDFNSQLQAHSYREWVLDLNSIKRGE